MGEGGEYGGDLMDFSDATEEERLNPLKLLARATRVLNPRQFELPKDVVCPINFPGLSVSYIVFLFFSVVLKKCGVQPETCDVIFLAPYTTNRRRCYMYRLCV